MTTDTTTPYIDQTAKDVLYSLNGFDEIAIAARFNASLSDLREESRAIELGRALAFVVFRREGTKDAEAWTKAQELTIRDVMGFFAPPAKPAKKKKKGKAVDTSPADGPEDAEGNGPTGS